MGIVMILWHLLFVNSGRAIGFFLFLFFASYHLMQGPIHAFSNVQQSHQLIQFLGPITFFYSPGSPV